MASQLDRIEWKLDQLLALLNKDLRAVQRGQSRSQEKASADGEDMTILQRMTIKQHAVLQMLMRGASNAEIGERFGVTENTAKVYVRTLANKFKVGSRSQLAVKGTQLLQEISEDDYRAIAKGLPKDWDATYDYDKPWDDPFWNSYTGARVKVDGEDAHEDGGNHHREG